MQYTATPIPRSFRMYISLCISTWIGACIGVRVACPVQVMHTCYSRDTVLVSRFSSRIRCRWTLGVIGNKLCGWMWLYQHIPYYPDELGVSFEYLVSDTPSIYPPLSGISSHLCASMFLKYAHWIIKHWNSSKLFPRIIRVTRLPEMKLFILFFFLRNLIITIKNTFRLFGRHDSYIRNHRRVLKQKNIYIYLLWQFLKYKYKINAMRDVSRWNFNLLYSDVSGVDCSRYTLWENNGSVALSFQLSYWMYRL